MAEDNMLRKAAMVFGVVFVLIGLLGFVDPLTTADAGGTRLLLGLFEVDAVHNLVHLLSGIVALVAASRADWSRLYFQVFGVVYAIVTLWGFLLGGPVLGFLHVNMFDNFLHLIIAAASLYLGFGYKNNERVTSTSV